MFCATIGFVTKTPVPPRSPEGRKSFVEELFASNCSVSPGPSASSRTVCKLVEFGGLDVGRVVLARLRDTWVESASGAAEVCLDGVSPGRPLGFTTGLNFCPPFSDVQYEYLQHYSFKQMHLRTLVDIRKKAVESQCRFRTPGDSRGDLFGPKICTKHRRRRSVRRRRCLQAQAI